MSATHQGRNAPGRLLFSSPSVAALALIATTSLFCFGVPHAAQSQISSKVITAPKFSASDSVHVTRAKLPKAPVQVAMPAPPAMRYVPGFAEPLVATGPMTDQESKDLDLALKAFHDAPAAAGKAGDFDDYAKPLQSFIAAHPQSNWNAALHTDIGYGDYFSGYYSRAFTEFNLAWQLGRNAPSPQAHMLIDRAVGELAKMHARVGHTDELEALMKDVGDRPLGGPGKELMLAARNGLWTFHHRDSIAYLCGPKALKNVLVALKASKRQIKIADDARSGPKGFTLTQLAALADKAHVKYRLIHREPGQPIPVPSVVNWNVHHYAAILGRDENGNYLVRDQTFGNDEGADTMTMKAIDAESSGYFLVPATVDAATPDSSWRTVSKNSEEARTAYGMGNAKASWWGLVMPCDACQTTGQPPAPTPNTIAPLTSTSTPLQALTTAKATPDVVSLHLEDTPVGYVPQIGLPNQDTISYNSREDLQPANMSYSNLSSNWSHSWQAMIQYLPTFGPNHPITRNAPGGGGYYNTTLHYSSINATTPETEDNSQLFVSLTGSTHVNSWTRKLPDGSSELYGLTNGATTYPAFMFLTQVTDPKGNVTTINYDSTFRITSVVDAMGRSTTFTYGLTGYPLLITQITDPFGRTSQFTYDTSQRLASITDPVGITSSFTYSTSEPTFVTRSLRHTAPRPSRTPQSQRYGRGQYALADAHRSAGLHGLSVFLPKSQHHSRDRPCCHISHGRASRRQRACCNGAILLLGQTRFRAGRDDQRRRRAVGGLH